MNLDLFKIVGLGFLGAGLVLTVVDESMGWTLASLGAITFAVGYSLGTPGKDVDASEEEDGA